MPLTRTQLIQSIAFQNLFALPNDQKCNILQKAIDDTAEPFDGWSAEVTAVDDSNINRGANDGPGMILMATTSNSAPGGDGIVQSTYYLTPTP